MTELFKREAANFLENKKALIFDNKRAQRNIAKEGLVHCGMRPQNIIIEKSFKNAKRIVEFEKPEIIVSEFQIHDDYGLDLAQIQMQVLDDSTKKVFIILTSGATQSAVADAAEEEVEAFLVSPISREKMIEYIYKAVKKKINPSAYASMIYECKRLIRKKQFDTAKQTLVIAKIMNDRPMMACYLSGEIYRLQGNFDSAMREFEEGLSYNDIHYKCLLGKFMALRNLKKKKEAFMCLEKLSKHFPLTPDLLKNAFILSITSYHFEEVQNYYDLYIKQPRKTNELKVTVSQALLTAGKILLRERRYPKRAFDYFKKGAIISGRKKPYLSQVLDTLIKEGFENQTQDFIKLFDPDEISATLLRQFSFKAFAKTDHTNINQIIEQGKELIFSGEADEEIYFLICDLLKTKKKLKLLESIVYKGSEDIPEIKNKLHTFLKAS
jgi:tetratricopeptide (TPR) repeat protein